MTHLGRWLSALVDGELDGVERDRVLNHVAGCDSCRYEANAMRALKRRLTAFGDASAEPTMASRLIELASDETAAAGEPPWVAQAGIAHAHRAADWASRLVARTCRLAAASAGASLITIGVLAFMLGNGATQPPVPKITPSVDSYLMQHEFDAGQNPAGSTPPVSNSPATPGSRLGLAAGQIGPGTPATGKTGHSIARPARHRMGGRSGTAAKPAGLAASPSPSPSSSAGQSAGPPVTSRHRG